MDKKGSKPAAKPKPGDNKSQKSAAEKKSQKEKEKHDKEMKSAKAIEEMKRKEKEEKYKKARFEYKDPHQLSEGEIMIVIEHSDDPGRVLMSTSHDYDKYKRIASKIRQWIMRDFPSMKVIIKPNNHQDGNSRIGCFEVAYFHMKEGQLQRQDIFSKMVERKWPKWKEVQEKIKKFVKNSNLVVKIEDLNPEKKNKFEGMVIHVKNVLFVKNEAARGATTKSLMGSSLVQSQKLGQSSLGKSTMSNQMTQSPPTDDAELTKFQEKISDSTGVLKFDHLPVGNYAIVFDGDRTYRPVKKTFQVHATEPEITEVIQVELVEEGFFSIEVDIWDLQEKKGKLNEDLGEIPQKDTEKRKKIEDEIKQLDLHEKKIGHYKISLIPSDPKREEDEPCIPIHCLKSTVPGGTNFVYEAVISPGSYDIMLTNGLDSSILKKGAQLTRGENKMALLAPKNNQIITDAEYKKIKDQREPKEEKEDSAGASGNAGHHGQHGTNTGQQRPNTTSSMMSDIEETHNRLGSADIRNRPGSASNMGRTQEIHANANTISKAQVIAEDPAENDEDKFMIKMFAENGELPFQMSLIYLDDDEVTQIINRYDLPKDGGRFEADNQKEVLTFEDARHREGYYRMIITRRHEVSQFAPVHVVINCNGICNAKKFSQDPFASHGRVEQYLDYAVFKFPDNVFLPLNILTKEEVPSPTFMLSQIRSLINKLSESKLKIDKIFGFGGKTTNVEGEECLSVAEVKKSLENFMIPISDHILQAFKASPNSDWISYRKLSETVESWRSSISVLDEINDEADEEDAANDDDYEDYGDFDNDNQN